MLKKIIKNSAPLLLLPLVFIIYSNVMGAPFIFDDLRYIADNAFIRDLSNFSSLSGTRYVAFLSFALNYAIGGLDPTGYHLVNIGIHGLNSILVFLLVSLLFKTPSCSPVGEHGGGGGRSAPGFQIAFVTALVFAAHPVETEAVAYVTQRFASLAALFYLFTLYCYVRSRLAFLSARRTSGAALFVLAFISGLMAQKTKETAFTLPAVIILVEFLFFQRARLSLKKGGVLALPFLTLFAVIPVTLFRPVSMGVETGMSQTLRYFQFKEMATLSRHDYLITQFRVIVRYIRLLFFPMVQRGDYDYTLYHSFFSVPVILSFVFLALIFFLALYLVLRSARRGRALGLMAGFGMLWFFITLSVESSVVPIKDIIFEHRVYLPSAGVFISAVSLYFYLAERGRRAGRTGHGHAGGVIILPLVIVLTLSALTYRRNRVWTSGKLFWSDVVSKSPQRARGYNNLGNALYRMGSITEAIKNYKKAIILKKEYYEAYNNLGTAFLALNKGGLALGNFNKALALRPDYFEAASNKALALVTLNRPEEAVRAARLSITLHPDFAAGHNVLGMALVDMGQVSEGIQHLREAVSLDPLNVDAVNNLGLALFRARRYGEAEAEFQKALAAAPFNANFSNNLNMAREAKKRVGMGNGAVEINP